MKIGVKREAKDTKLNLLAFINVPLIIWLGVSGRVGWWIILLLFLTNSSLDLSRILKKVDLKYFGGRVFWEL